MAGAIGVLKIALGVLGFIPFAMDAFGPKDDKTSVIRLTVGLDVAGGLNNAGGDLPDVRLFNEAGGFIGISADPGIVDDGSTAEFKVNQDNGQQAAYALFTANDNAICVAAISITWPNGDQYGWVGDWGWACDGSWYYSNVFVKGSDYKPTCLWIDANGDQPQTGFQIHWPEFTNKNADGKLPANKDRDYFCYAGPPFKLYTDPEPRGITYWVPPTKKNKRTGAGTGTTTATTLAPPRYPRTHIHSRRHHLANNTTFTNSTASNTIPTNRFADYLVLDTATDHSAAQLCGSSTSVGPDFANAAERLFCRMSDKTLWPFCDGTTVTDDCFDERVQQLVVGGKVARKGGYANVVSWGDSSSKGKGKGGR